MHPPPALAIVCRRGHCPFRRNGQRDGRCPAGPRGLSSEREHLRKIPCRSAFQADFEGGERASRRRPASVRLSSSAGADDCRAATRVDASRRGPARLAARQAAHDGRGASRARAPRRLFRSRLRHAADLASRVRAELCGGRTVALDPFRHDGGIPDPRRFPCRACRRGRGARGRPRVFRTGEPTGFPILLAMGTIDNATRTAFLTFLPFLLRLKGAELPTIGLALTLAFIGGPAGKLICTFVGMRIGVFATVMLTESLTALGIFALLPLPLAAALPLIPLVGVALSGTSSVLYGSVAHLVTPAARTRAFAVFYTGTIGGGALAPFAYGLATDALGIAATIAVIAAVALLTLPLAVALRGSLKQASAARV